MPAAWLLVSQFRKAEAPEIIWNSVSQKGLEADLMRLQWVNEELLRDTALKHMSSGALETSHVQPPRPQSVLGTLQSIWLWHTILYYCSNNNLNRNLSDLQSTQHQPGCSHYRMCETDKEELCS